MKHKNKTLSAWKEAMIDEIRKVNAFLRFLQTIGPSQIACYNFAFSGKRIAVRRSHHRSSLDGDACQSTR
jgi:hypothetical protein